MQKPIAIYSSGRSKDTAALRRWSREQTAPVRWFRDQPAGATPARPGWSLLLEAIRSGSVRTVVAWQVSQLGLSVKELTALLKELRERHADLLLIADGFRLSSAAGQRTARFVESVVQTDNAVRTARIVAGQAASRARGIRFGRRPGQGTRIKVTPALAETICRLRGRGWKIAAIARNVGLSRPTIYDVLGRARTSAAAEAARA